MILARATLLLLVVSLGACRSKPDPAPSGPRLPSARITLERTVCYGTCPVYRVSIRIDGTVEYTGSRYVAVAGHADAKIDPKKANELFERLDKSGFWGWNDSYDLPVTDNPSAILTAEVNGKRKIVSDHPPCNTEAVGGVVPPKELCELEKAIDEVTGALSWSRCRDDAGAERSCEPTPPALLPGCTPPYELDSAGNKHFKPDCL